MPALRVGLSPCPCAALGPKQVGQRQPHACHPSSEHYTLPPPCTAALHPWTLLGTWKGGFWGHSLCSASTSPTSSRGAGTRTQAGCRGAGWSPPYQTSLGGEGSRSRTTPFQRDQNSPFGQALPTPATPVWEPTFSSDGPFLSKKNKQRFMIAPASGYVRIPGHSATSGQEIAAFFPPRTHCEY